MRVGPNATMRQAGGAILVDNHPVSSPYRVDAIGPPNTLRDNFEASPAMLRLRQLESAYQAGLTISTGDGLTLPAGTGREVTFARALPS